MEGPSDEERSPLDPRSPPPTEPADETLPLEETSTATMAKQGSITFAGELIGKVFGFLIVAIITRLVSPSVYGLFILATSIILFVQAFANLGLPKAIDYFAPQYIAEGDYGRAKGVIVEVFAIMLVSSTLVAALIFFNADRIALAFDEPALSAALLLLAISVPFLAINNALLTSFGAIKRLRFRVYQRDIIRPTVRLFSTTLLLLVGFGLLGVVGGYLLGLIVAISAGAVLLYRNVPKIRAAETTLVSPGPLLSYSVPLAFAGIIYVFLGQIDYFVIGFFLTSEEVGIYRVGYALAANLMIFLSAVAPIFKPLIAEAKDDDEAVTERYRTATRWVAGLTLPLGLTIALGAPEFLSLVFTPQYTAATAAVVILCVGYFVNASCGGPDGTLLQGLGYARLVFVNTTILLATNLVVSVTLVPRIGITGAAIGTASALTITGLAALAEAYYFHGVHPFTADLGKVFLAAIPAAIAGGLVVLFVPTTILVATVLPVVVYAVYAAVLVATDAFTEDDAEIAAQLSPSLRRVVRLARSE